MPPLSLVLILLALQAEADPGLAARIRSGDRQAFRELFDRHHAALFSYLRSRGFDATTAEEAVQEAFVRIWEKRATIDPKQSVRAYLYRIAINQSLNERRATVRLVSDEGMETPDTAPSPEAETSEDEVRGRLLKAVATLPERRREVFELCFVRGLTYREAAEALEISIKTVENQMAHALKFVREAMLPFREDSPTRR